MTLLHLILLSFVPMQGDPAADRVASPTQAAGQSPDVLLLIVDDLGWHDVGFTGGKSHLTPRIDALAEQSTIFENA